jgi:hypothetical protein
MFTMVIVAVSTWTLVHDYKRPDLDQWYGSLRRPGMSSNWSGISSCCSKKDCHTTEAELRDGVWWARIGKPVDRADGSRDWILGDYVRVPDELIVKGNNGLPVANPEGEAVLCHSIAWKNANEIDSGNTTLFCFVPGTES